MTKRPTIITTLGGALALTALIAVAGPAGAAYPGANGRLAFGVTAPGNAQPDVYSVLPTGEAMHRLTDDPAFDACAAYSADGKQIAYCSSVGDPTGQFDIWTMKQNGKDKRRLTQLGGSAIFPDFSPDGTKIAFNSLPAGATNQDVYVMNADGSGRYAVHPGGGQFVPAWQPHPDDKDE